MCILNVFGFTVYSRLTDRRTPNAETQIAQPHTISVTFGYVHCMHSYAGGGLFVTQAVLVLFKLVIHAVCVLTSIQGCYFLLTSLISAEPERKKEMDYIKLKK